MYKQPLLSIIVPVFNTEKFLKKCLESLVNQTYKNIEIIVVNDATKDSSMKIAKTYESIDERVHIVEHKENKGLFQARLTGAEVAKGEYIAFVDSDDYVMKDFYRILVREAEMNKSDITLGNTVLEDENNWKYIYNIPLSFTRDRQCLEGSEIIDELLNDEGLYFSWHTVWNKIYSRKLWEKCVPHYKKINKHLIMTEDIAFSTVLYYYADKMKFVNHDAYIYYRHSEASTGSVKSLQGLKKNIADLELVFNFIKEFMQEQGIYEKYHDKYIAWRKRYFRWWSHNVQEATKNFKGKAVEEIKQYFLEVFEEEELCLANKDDGFFSSVRTGWQGEYQHLKNEILDPKIKYVSFDIFDTLILRPLLEPTDLFIFMDSYFKSLVPDSKLSFASLRKFGEQVCRKNMKIAHPFYEDVNLQEIYAEIHKVYGIDNKICTQLMRKEEELEIAFCRPRYAIKELYDLAIEVGKEVILISDMYLSKEIIETILTKNGYTEYKKLYLSSEERVLKYSGNLFKKALQELEIENPSEVLHLGDNYEVDIKASKKIGMRNHYIPKTKDVFLNQTYIKNVNDSTIYFKPKGQLIDYTNGKKQFSTRCLLALVANHMFDNPYVSYNQDSDFNADPYYIGYYLIGMNMVGLNKWLLEDAKKKGYETIHFIARDGYLPKKVYDILAKAYEQAPKSNYIYASRKSLIPTLIRCSYDLYALIEHIQVINHTPRSILEMLKVILKEYTPQIEELYLEEKILLDSNFESIEQFNLFIKLVIKISYDQDIVDEYQEGIRKYFSNIIREKDCTFDLGYSGKIQKMLVDILHRKVDTYFLHSNGESTQQLAKEGGFEVNSYYDYVPAISGIIREYLVSDYRPSCIGYNIQNNSPVFEANKFSYQEKYILDEIFRGATNFATDFVKIFKENIQQFYLNTTETSSALENFLCEPAQIDKQIFASSYIEDEVHGGISKMDIRECWDWHLRNKMIKGNRENAQYGKMPKELEDLYLDGLFMAFYKKMNKIFPKGSKKREGIKKCVGTFLK